MNTKLPILVVIFASVTFCAVIKKAQTASVRNSDGLTVFRKSLKPTFHAYISSTEEEESPGAVESDMILTGEQLQERAESLIPSGQQNSTKMKQETRFKRKAILGKNYLWPNGIVPYIIDPTITSKKAKDAITEAMKHWQENTCIRFHPKPSREVNNDHVVFYKGVGCTSNVGKTGKAQWLSVGNRCDKMGIIAHEIGHTLGFHHEQSRSDRDNYVSIESNNIISGKAFNFNKEIDANYNVGYDLGSIMHYGPMYFSKSRSRRLITVKTKDESKQFMIGQRDQLSFKDIILVNEMYSCNAHCKNPKRCENNGYTGPNCECICPDGLAGSTCTELKPNSECGSKFTGTSGTFTSPDYPKGYGNDRACYWLVQAPSKNHKITLTFEDFMVEDDIYCGYDWLEVRKDGPDNVGGKYCGDKLHKKSISLIGQAMVLKLNSDDDFSEKGFKVSYKIEPFYKVQNDGHSGWGKFGRWNRCPVTCGGGMQIRTRKCETSSCQGSSYEFKTCNTNSC